MKKGLGFGQSEISFMKYIRTTLQKTYVSNWPATHVSRMTNIRFQGQGQHHIWSKFNQAIYCQFG